MLSVPRLGLRLKMKEVSVEWANDDRSKINPIVDGVKMFYELLTIRVSSLLGRYEHPKFQFLASTPGTVLVEDKRPA
jgi:hypothetical protein